VLKLPPPPLVFTLMPCRIHSCRRCGSFIKHVAKQARPACGLAPSLLVAPVMAEKVLSTVKSEPSVLIANTVPYPLLPPEYAFHKRAA